MVVGMTEPRDIRQLFEDGTAIDAALATPVTTVAILGRPGR